MVPTAWERSKAPTEKVELGRRDGATLVVTRADSRLEAAVVAQGVLTLNALIGDGPCDAGLALKVDGNFVTVGFLVGMTKAQLFGALRRCLPPGYEAQSLGTENGVLVVSVVRLGAQQGELELEFTCTDPAQRVRWAGPARLRIDGRAARSLSMRSELELRLERHVVRVVLRSGDHPLATAVRLRKALPPSYRALIELPTTKGGEVTVTILRQRPALK